MPPLSKYRSLLITTFAVVSLMGPGSVQADIQAGFAERDITPTIPDRWVDVDDNAQFDPAVDTWKDVNGNGEFDAVWMAGFQN